MMRRRFKKAWRLKESEEGVASVVGTIMALMVFLAFLSLFINQWVPVMMNDNEASHMAMVINQFGNLKQQVDNLIVNWPNSEGVNMYNAVTMNSAGVPLFAAETPGELSLRVTKKTGQFGYNVGEISLKTVGGRAADPTVNQSSSGCIRFFSSNRHYVPQSIIYENGALIVSQQEGSSIKGFPDFTVQKIGSAVSIKMVLVKVMGVDTNVGSYLAGASPVEGINTKMLFVTKDPTTGGVNNYAGNYKNVSFNMTTDNYKGWFSFINSTLSNKLGAATGVQGNTANLDGVGVSLDSDGVPDDFRVTGPGWQLTFYRSYLNQERNDRISLMINNVNIIGVTVANVWVSVGEANLV